MKYNFNFDNFKAKETATKSKIEAATSAAFKNTSFFPFQQFPMFSCKALMTSVRLPYQNSNLRKYTCIFTNVYIRY